MTDHNDRFGKAIPVLASLDITRTLTFFEKILKFETHPFENPAYGIARRGEVEIHFWKCEDKYISDNTSCYVHVDDVYGLYKELKPMLPTLNNVIETAWGMAELYVIDPDGNLLKFGQALAKKP